MADETEEYENGVVICVPATPELLAMPFNKSEPIPCADCGVEIVISYQLADEYPKLRRVCLACAAIQTAKDKNPEFIVPEQVRAAAAEHTDITSEQLDVIQRIMQGDKSAMALLLLLASLQEEETP